MWNTRKDNSKEHAAEREPLQRQAAGLYYLFGRPLQFHGATLLAPSCMHSLHRIACGVVDDDTPSCVVCKAKIYHSVPLLYL